MIPIFFVKRPWPIFWVITALIVWNHLCESCNGFLRPFFNKMLDKARFCYWYRLVWELLRFFTIFFQQNVKKNTALLRVGLQCSFDMTICLVITGKNNILPKNVHYGFFPQWQENCVCVCLAFQVYNII